MNFSIVPFRWIILLQACSGFHRQTLNVHGRFGVLVALGDAWDVYFFFFFRCLLFLSTPEPLNLRRLLKGQEPTTAQRSTIHARTTSMETASAMPATAGSCSTASAEQILLQVCVDRCYPGDSICEASCDELVADRYAPTVSRIVSTPVTSIPGFASTKTHLAARSHRNEV